MSVADDIKTSLKEAIEYEKRNKIAKDLCSKYSMCTCNERDGHCSTPQQHAKIIQELGYRKEEDTILEIRRRLQEAINEEEKTGHKKPTALGMKRLVDRVLNEYVDSLNSKT